MHIYQHNIDCDATHAHAAWPSVSKARLQKFPLLIVCVHVCVCAEYVEDKTCQTEEMTPTGYRARGGTGTWAAQQQHDLLFKDKLLIVFHLHLNPV